MINGLTGGVFHDDERFWPIYERAAALDVPIYIHPALPQAAVVETYYKGYVEKHPGLLRAGWGFTVETATQGIRFVLEHDRFRLKRSRRWRGSLRIPRR